MDVWVSSVAVFGIVFGAGAIWWLVRRKQRGEVGKDWHFWSKLVGPFLLHNSVFGLIGRERVCVWDRGLKDKY